MASLLIRNIRRLVGCEERPRTEPLRGAALDQLPTLDEAFLLVEGERIADFGPMSACPDRADRVLDASGRFLFPCWCDSHTHLVFAGSREQEFVDRIRGLSYQEIARRGGGILNSARRLRRCSEDELFKQAAQRLQEVVDMGTGLVEIKSGYGLDPDSELKMLRVVRRLKESSPALVKATFLGAHAIPEEYRADPDAYVRVVVEQMLPRVADEGLAEYVDVFCEKVAFSAAQTERILEAGVRRGLRPKIHTNQFTSMGGIQVAVKFDALSVDHLEVMEEAEIECLARSNTIACLLPSAPFFLNDPYPPARQIIEAGIPVALASDYNPGSSPSGNMPFVLSLACIKMRMTPAEAIQAATLNGAFAVEAADQTGSIARGKLAHFFLTRPLPSEDFLPYAFGSRLVEWVFLRGRPAGGISHPPL